MSRSGRSTIAATIYAALRNPVAGTAAVFLLLVVLAAIFAPVLSPHPPEAVSLDDRLAAPSGTHWLGTDELGRDLLSRLMSGARVSLTVSVASVCLAAAVGVLLGGLAAVRGRLFQGIVMRLTDVMLSFPEILLAIVLMAVLGASLTNVVIAIGISYAPKFLRLTWSSLLVVREQTYVEAARSSGTGTMRILLRHMLPNILPVLLVQATLSLGFVILVESALSYLGLGVQPPQASWGSMINSSQLYLTQSPYAVIFPGLVIMLTVLALNFLGDALAEGLDPRLRGQTGEVARPGAASTEVAAEGAAPVTGEAARP
jgi:peptide/nickel transport system permease protein